MLINLLYKNKTILLFIRSLTLVVLFLVTGATLSAQIAEKLPLKLHHIAKDQARSNEIIPLLVKGDLSQIKMLTLKLGGTYKYGYSGIASIAIPASNLESFSSSLAVQKIENSHVVIKNLMDESIHNNNIDSVHNGAGTLPEGYTGKNVIIGVIDVGIYFDHPDFEHEDGSTRIRYIWDQNIPNPDNTPLPYNYGQEWTSQDINNGSCTHIEPSNGFSHGTNVAGIAAGDGSAMNNYKGAAPESDLIIVSLDQSDFLTNVVDAVDYIFKKADAMGKPCVINTSVGTYVGSHDGKDLHSQMIEALLEERTGRAVVAAAGNAGHIIFHLGYEVEEDPLFTWFFEVTPSAPLYYEVYSDTADFNQVDFYFSADHPGLYHTMGETDWINIPDDFSVSPGNPGLMVQSINDANGNLLGQIWVRVEEDQGVYKMEVEIFPVVNFLLWRFSTKGNGRFDVWSSKGVTGSSNIYYAPLPTTAQLPEIDRYMLPDNLKTIVSSWQCSDKVITVANYTNRVEYLDYDSNLHNVNTESGALLSTTGDLFPTSSFGPSRDNRVKPDLAATGSATMATANLVNAGLLIGSNQGFKVAPGGMHNRNGGTSMASPVVAGIAALYLEKNPDADWSEIKQVLINTTTSDAFTSTIPNPGWGHGKVNAFGALSFPVITGCTDLLAINFDSTANIDDGTCIYPVYGCTDILASNFSSEANVEDSSCIYINTSITEILSDDQLVIYPNPVIDELNITLNSNPASFPIQLSVYDVSGRNIHEVIIENKENLHTIALPGSIDNGIYQVQILTDDYRYFERLVVLK